MAQNGVLDCDVEQIAFRYEDIPMVHPATASWNLQISQDDFVKLEAGFEGQDMDDHWHVRVAKLAWITTISVTILRSWTGFRHYILVVEPSNIGNGATIVSITWEQNLAGIHISEEAAKQSAVILSRSLLECQFEGLPEYDFSILWDHPLSDVDPAYKEMFEEWLARVNESRRLIAGAESD